MSSESTCIATVRHSMRRWPLECGTRLARARLARGLSRAELARLAGTTEPTIHRVEHGKLTPRDHLRVALALALGVDVGHIWQYPGTASPDHDHTGEHHHG